MTYSPDGKTLYVGTSSGGGMAQVMKYNAQNFVIGPESPPLIQQVEVPKGYGSVDSLSVSPNGNLLLISFNNGYLGQVQTSDLTKKDKTIAPPN